jgi:hypothetical protein
MVHYSKQLVVHICVLNIFRNLKTAKQTTKYPITMEFVETEEHRPTNKKHGTCIFTSVKIRDRFH